MAKLLVNWYMPSGKWYARTELEAPDSFQIQHTNDNLKEFCCEAPGSAAYCVGQW